MRNHHFLSKLEYHTALLIAYSGAEELRECFPIWPWEHPHPNCGLDDDFDMRGEVAPGLLDIANAAGIEHGRFVGTSVPYIASIDLMFRVRQGHKWRLLGVSCKPRDITNQSIRAKERIELDRLYCKAVGALHCHEDGTTIESELIHQLHTMKPAISFLRAHRQTNRLQDFVGKFNEHAPDMAVTHAALAAGRAIGIGAQDAFAFYRLGVWLHLIDIDLTKRVQMLSPIKRGGTQVIERLRARYMGGSHD